MSIPSGALGRQRPISSRASVTATAVARISEERRNPGRRLRGRDDEIQSVPGVTELAGETGRQGSGAAWRRSGARSEFNLLVLVTWPLRRRSAGALAYRKEQHRAEITRSRPGSEQVGHARGETSQML